MASTLDNNMNLDCVSQSQSHRLEKCFYEMQTRCQNEIDRIESVLFSPQMLISENTDFKNIFAEAINNLNNSITSAVGFYAETLMTAKHGQSNIFMVDEVRIGGIIKEKFVDELNIEIYSLANLIVNTINKPSLLHPTVLIQYHVAVQKIKDIRPSTLMDLVNKIEI